jgi:hypothetical protein
MGRFPHVKKKKKNNNNNKKKNITPPLKKWAGWKRG